MTKNTPDPKTTYLNTIRDLVTKLHARNGLSLCPWKTASAYERDIER